MLPTEIALFRSSHGELRFLAAIWPLHMLNPQSSTMQYSTIDATDSRAYRITDTAMENFSNVVYTSREFNLSNRLFEDSPVFGEPQTIFVRSTYACVRPIYCYIV